MNNNNKADEPQDENGPDDQAYIYGDDHYLLENRLSEIMQKWNIFKSYPAGFSVTCSRVVDLKSKEEHINGK